MTVDANDVTISISLNGRVRDLADAILDVLGEDKSEQSSADVLAAALLIAVAHGTTPEDAERIIWAAGPLVIRAFSRKAEGQP